MRDVGAKSAETFCARKNKLLGIQNRVVHDGFLQLGNHQSRNGPLENRGTYEAWDDQVRTYVIKGDYQRALEALVHGYQDAVVRHCVSLLSNEAQGQDIAQEVFVAAYESMMRLQSDFARRIDVRPWLFGIARNKCKQYWRNTQRRRTILGERRQSIAESVHRAEHGVGLEALASEHEQEDGQRTERLLACMKKLTHRERTLITLRYDEKLTLDALAKKYWMSEATVRRRLKAVEAKLRACIERGG